MNERFSFEQAACEACKRFAEMTLPTPTNHVEPVQENMPEPPTIASALMTDEND
jgi:hypothetical protein